MRRLLLAMDILLVSALAAAALHAIDGRREVLAECTDYVASRGLDPAGICREAPSVRSIPRYAQAKERLESASRLLREGRADEARGAIRTSLDEAVELDRGPSMVSRVVAAGIYRDALRVENGEAIVHAEIRQRPPLRGVLELLEVSRLGSEILRRDTDLLDRAEDVLVGWAGPVHETTSRANDERFAAALDAATCEAIQDRKASYGFLPDLFCPHLLGYKETEDRLRAIQ